MKTKLQRFITKLLSLVLIVILAIPSQIFASGGRKKNTTYDGKTSIMGLASANPVADTLTTSPEKETYTSDISYEETDQYRIEKSATIDRNKGQISYKIVLRDKFNIEQDPSIDQEMLTTSFAVNSNSDHRDIIVDDVMQIDAEGNEFRSAKKVSRPNMIENTKHIQTVGIKTVKPQYGVVYYLTSRLDAEVKKDLDAREYRFALDMSVNDHAGYPIYEDRYALSLDTKNATGGLTIDQDGKVSDEADLVELTGKDKKFMTNGVYIEEINALINYVPATIKWSDYIFPQGKNQEFTYYFNLDENQDTTNTQIRLEFYEAQENGFVKNNSYTQFLPYSDYLNLMIPEGQFARVVFSTTVTKDKTVPYYTFNGKKIANLEYDLDGVGQAESKNDPEEDPLPETKPEEDPNTSGVVLNSYGLIEKLQNDDRYYKNTSYFVKNTVESLDNYNTDLINYDQLVEHMAISAGIYKIEQNLIEEVVTDLTNGLSEAKYENLANVDPAKLAAEVAESAATPTSAKANEKEEKPTEILSKEVKETSGLELNKDALVQKLENEGKLDQNTKYFIRAAITTLENYNSEVIDETQLLDILAINAGLYFIEEETIAQILDALTQGLSEDKYGKIAKMDPAKLANLVYEAATTPSESIKTQTLDSAGALGEDEVSEEGEEEIEEGAEVPEEEPEVEGGADLPNIDELVKEKLAEEDLTLEAFQNYMYEIGDQYSLTNEEVDKIYTENKEAIEALIEKHKDENIDPNVLAVTGSFSDKTFVLNAPISVKAAPTWAIPAGWWFDVHIGEYLYPGKYELKSLTDPNNPNVVVAVPQYIPNQNKIRYTFPRRVNLTKNLVINQELQFRTESIPAGTNSIDINVKIAPKNNPAQSAPTVKVDANGPQRIPLNYTAEFAGEESAKEGATIPANSYREIKDWSEEDGLNAIPPQYQVGIDGYGNPVQEGDKIKEIEWTVTYLSHKSLTDQGLLASLTAVEGSGIDTNAISGITINGRQVNLYDNPANGSHGINDSRYTEFKDNQGGFRYEIKFKTPVTKHQDYYTLDFYGRLNNVYDRKLSDKPHGSARLAVPGYINQQEAKGNPNAAYADNRETITGEYTNLGTNDKPTGAKWIVTEHITTKHGGSNPFKTRELTNQDLESLKVSFYQPDAQGKLIQIGVTEEHKNNYPLATNSLLQNPPVGTIVVYEYITKLKGDPYQTKYSLDNVTLGDFNKTYTVIKEWQGIDSRTKIPAIDVTLNGSDGMARATGRLTGNIDQNRREIITIDAPKWGISQNNDGTLKYNNITYKATEEKASTLFNSANFTNVSNHVIEEKNEVELINQVIQVATPGKLSVKLLDSSSNEPLSNVEFTLRSPDFDKTARTDADGIISFDNLPAGPYTLVQNDNKVSYRKPLINGHIEVKSDGKISWRNNELIATPYNFDVSNPSLTVYNDKLPPAEFSFTKVDGNNRGLQGAKFVLKDINGNIVETVYSASNGLVDFTNISPGKYTLEEVAAPDGYANLGISYEVSIDESNYIEITNGNKIIASGYPGNMAGGGTGSSGQSNVTVNRNGFKLREFGQSGGRAGVMDRLRFETLTYNLNMNVQNPSPTDTFTIRLDKNLDIERNISGKFPNIYDNNGRLVAEYIGFNENTNAINFKFDPKYVNDYNDINIKYEIVGIRPDDYKVLNKYGEGGINGYPAAKKWDFKSYIDYNGRNIKTDNYNIEIDMASGDSQYPVYSADQMGSHIVDIIRNPNTRKPEKIKTVFYFNPIPNTSSKDYNITADFMFQTQAGNKSHNMSFNQMKEDPYHTRGYDFKEARVYRVSNSDKFNLMPTSYGINESLLGIPSQTINKNKVTLTNNKRTQELKITGMNNTGQDGWVIVMDFDVTNPEVIDSNFITLIMKQNNRMQRGFIMKPGRLSASASATTNQGPVLEPFTFEVPNESYKEGRFELTKFVSGPQNPLAGATFTLTDKSTGYVVSQQTTADDGKLSFENLKPGNYTLVETSAPLGYIKPENTSWDIRVDNTGKTTVSQNDQVKAVYNSNVMTNITNNGKTNNLDGKGTATTTVEELGNNRFKISTTLSGYSQYQEAVGEDNKVYTSGPTRSYAGDEDWHWLEMENYAKASYQGDSPKAEFYLLLNSKSDLGDINQHTHLDLEGTNVRIDSVEMRGLGNNNDSNGKAHITNFKNGYAESVFASSSRTAFAPHTYTVTRPVNEKYKQQINIPKERFGHMKEGDEGHWMFIVKVTATVEDPSKASSLDAKWIYDVDQYQDRNISENTMNLDALGDAYKPAGYRNTLQGELVHNIGSGFRLLSDSPHTFKIDQGNGTITKTSIVEFIGSTGNYSPLQSLSFKYETGGTSTINSSYLPSVSFNYIRNSNQPIIVNNDTNEISFVKYGVENGDAQKLSNVNFQLLKDGRAYGEVKSSSESIRYTSLPDGNYSLREIIKSEEIDYDKSKDGYLVYRRGEKYYKAPADQIVASFNVINGKISNVSSWRTDDNKTNASMKQASGTNDITIDNEYVDIPKTGRFKIRKVSDKEKDEFGNPKTLAGAKFKLVQTANGEEPSSTNKITYESAEFTTNSNGELYFYNVPYGTYYLEEVAAPAGHTITNKYTKVVVSDKPINDGGGLNPSEEDNPGDGNSDDSNNPNTPGPSPGPVDPDPEPQPTPPIDEAKATIIKVSPNKSFINATREKTSRNDRNPTSFSFQVVNGQIDFSGKPVGNYTFDDGFGNQLVVNYDGNKATITSTKQYPTSLDLSTSIYRTIVTMPDGKKEYIYPNYTGKIPTTTWPTGRYKVEDEPARKLYTVDIVDGYVKSISEGPLYERTRLNSWNSNTEHYVADSAYPSYLNAKDFSKLTNPATGEITTYILLKPDSNNGGNGTDRDTILTVNSSNATIKQIDLYRVNNKYNASNAMNPYSLEGQFSNGNINKPPTQENNQKYPITIAGKENNSVETDTTSASVKFPYQRFSGDWTCMIVVKSTVNDKSKEAEIKYVWDTDRNGTNSSGGNNYNIDTKITSKPTIIPALDTERKVSLESLDIPYLAKAKEAKTTEKSILNLLIPTSYAAGNDKKSDIVITPNKEELPEGMEFSDQYSITIVNKKETITGKFRVQKVDENGDPKSGATFKLMGDEEIPFNDVESTLGLVEFIGLKPGITYTLTEDTAPDGYIKLNHKWQVTVDNQGKVSISLDGQTEGDGFEVIDGDTLTLKVTNRKPTYPSTGGNGVTIAFALIGTAVMLVGIAYFGIHTNNKNRRRSNRFNG